MPKYFLIGGGIVLGLLFVFGLSRVRMHGAVSRAFADLAQADSFHTQTELVMNLPARLRGKERPFTKTTVRLDGEVRKTGDKTPEFAGSLYLEARGRGNIFFADGQARILRDRVLFNLDNLPVFLNPSGSLVKRWTKVEAPLLEAKNGVEVREVLRGIMAKATPAGKGPLGEARGKGEQLARFSIALSAEQEKMVADTLRRSRSGSPALNVLARLLDANILKELMVWVDGGEIRQVRARFMRPLSNGQEFDFATLTLRFTDYNKDVTIDAPPAKRVVQPAVFARIFGGGTAEELKVEGQTQP